MFKKDVGIALSIFMVLMLILVFGFDFRPPGLVVVGIYILIYLVVSTVLSRREAQKNETPQPELPTSGPIGRFGQAGLLFTFTVTGLLSLLNPFQLTQIVMQLVGNL